MKTSRVEKLAAEQVISARVAEKSAQLNLRVAELKLAEAKASWVLSNFAVQALAIARQPEHKR